VVDNIEFTMLLIFLILLNCLLIFPPPYMRRIFLYYPLYGQKCIYSILEVECLVLIVSSSPCLKYQYLKVETESVCRMLCVF
jgi:hypothetical protein